MLTFVTSGAHQYTVRDVLETRKTPLDGNVHVLPYREFLRLEFLPVSDYIFLDIERLDEGTIRAAAARIDRLLDKYPGLKVLNWPRIELSRLSVMSLLHARGLNSFQVVPALKPHGDLTFPVFLRHLDDHNGPITDPLRCDTELQGALDEISASGLCNTSLAITEYVETRNAEGLFEKRSYFRVGDTYFPGALNFGRNWVCKGVAAPDETPAQRERRRVFLQTNPDEDLIRPFFEAAGISYGRADYAIVDGRPQVFEINTNPMIVPPERLGRDDRQFARIILDRWLDALVGFSRPPARDSHGWVRTGAAMMTGLPAPGEHVMRRAVRRVLRAADLLHAETTLMRPLRRLGIAR